MWRGRTVVEALLVKARDLFARDEKLTPRLAVYDAQSALGASHSDSRIALAYLVDEARTEQLWSVQRSKMLEYFDAAVVAAERRR